MNKNSIRAVAVAGCLVATTALAHHSGTMFDESKMVKYQGTVKRWEWTNPHSFLYLEIKGADGAETEYQFETGSPNTMFRNGWRKDSFKPGDKVAIYAYPLKQGIGGMMVTARTASGEALQWLPAAATAKAKVVE
ncbi:MAG: DUF6152 family protein [Steroidobacteraceae bacterium]